jgi:hypothetical protein
MLESIFFGLGIEFELFFHYVDMESSDPLKKDGRENNGTVVFEKEGTVMPGVRR